MTRETRWDLKTGKHAGARCEISKRQLYAAHDPEQVFGHYQEWAARRIMSEIEGMGLTTHLDIIKGHGVWDRYEDPMLFGITLRGEFPPRAPIPGEEAICEDGPLATRLIPVPDGLTYEAKVTTPDGSDSKYLRTKTDTYIYEPVAFDTATGRWVYHTI